MTHDGKFHVDLNSVRENACHRLTAKMASAITPPARARTPQVRHQRHGQIHVQAPIEVVKVIPVVVVLEPAAAFSRLRSPSRVRAEAKECQDTGEADLRLGLSYFMCAVRPSKA